MSAETSAAERVAVVGTAGHIDHGKTALVKRLTGVDTDRLPEEKARGISIDLGFARLVTPAGVRVGIVDVPGHERFVKNMLAGVGGIDLVLLVVAADEGVMPQTREHLAIVRLLGIPRGIVVLTKADLVERDWITMVARDVRALLAGTALAEAPVVEWSAVTGAGQPELLAALDRALAELPPRPAAEPPRLPVDRVFVMEGFGTVVTGTLWRGRVRTGDSLELLPSGRAVRVRRVQVHNQTVDEARAGQRTAIALHGVSKDEVARGDWLVAPGSLQSSALLDVRFELLPDLPRALKSGARVRFHLGAAEHLGRLALLEGTTLAPGANALAQVRLESKAVAARGDRFVVRAYSPSRTIGGGAVIEPVAQRRTKRTGDVATLAVRESGTLGARLLQQLEQSEKPAATAVLAKAVGEPEAAVTAALAALVASGDAVSASEGRWVASARWKQALTAVLAAVAAYLAKHPARFGIAKGDLKSGLRTAMDGTLFDAAFGSLATQGVLVMRGDLVRPGAEPWQPPADMVAALEKLEAELEAAGYLVPDHASLQKSRGAAAGEIFSLGLFLGRLVRVSQDLFYTARQLERLREGLRGHFAKQPALTVAGFREITGASRKYAVPLLEHADRLGWTMRVGDERKAGAKL